MELPRPIATLFRLFKEGTTLDTRSIALFRMCLGALIILDLLSRAKDLDAFYTDAGLIPRSLIGGAFSLHALSGEAWWQWLLFAAAAVAAVCLIIGLKPRLSATVSWVLLISVQNRNPFIAYGFDMALVLLVFWAQFLPLGERWALAPKAKPLSRVRSVGTIAIISQVVMLYFFSGVFKMLNHAWFPSLQGVRLSMLLNPPLTPVGQLIASNPGFASWLTLLTLALELLAPLLLFIPMRRARLRWLGVGAIIFFQLCLGLSLNLNLFPLASSLGALLLIPSSFWERARHDRKDAPDTLGPALRVVVIVALGVCLALNFQSLGIDVVPGPLDWASQRLHLWQGWDFFGSIVTEEMIGRVGRAYAAIGFAQGHARAYLSSDADRLIERPPTMAELRFTDLRWGKYRSRLRDEWDRERYAGYLCGEWRSRGGAPLERIELYSLSAQERAAGAVVGRPIGVYPCV